LNPIGIRDLTPVTTIAIEDVVVTIETVAVTTVIVAGLAKGIAIVIEILIGHDPRDEIDHVNEKVGGGVDREVVTVATGVVIVANEVATEVVIVVATGDEDNSNCHF